MADLGETDDQVQMRQQQRNCARWKCRHPLLRAPIVVSTLDGALPGRYPKPLSYDVKRRVPPMIDIEFARPTTSWEKPLGLKWREVSSKPTHGIVVENTQLAEALKRQKQQQDPELAAALRLNIEFSDAQFAQLGVQGLRRNSFVQVGDRYFELVDPDDPDFWDGLDAGVLGPVRVRK